MNIAIPSCQVWFKFEEFKRKHFVNSFSIRRSEKSVFAYRLSVGDSPLKR